MKHSIRKFLHEYGLCDKVRKCYSCGGNKNYNECGGWFSE